MKTKIFKWIAALSIILIITLGIFFAEAIIGYTHRFTVPGPLSEARASGGETTKGGYSSHADFEQQCGHCHAPLHCVTDTRCQDCHMDIAEQRLDASGLHALLPGVEQCQDCHVEHRGRDASITEFAYQNIDHELMAGYSLVQHTLDYEGAPLTCSSCHREGNYKPEALDCITCHISENHDQMADHIELYGSECFPCHDGKDRMVNYQHEADFPLDGAHQDTNCLTCHIDRVFAGTPRECAGCHQSPNDTQLMVFGTKCERCHATTAWVPAQLTMHTFLVEHGIDDESDMTCETCHIDTYTHYPCYSCHEDQEMRDYHAEIDIEAHDNCIDCHPTGRQDEADAFMKTDSGL